MAKPWKDRARINACLGTPDSRVAAHQVGEHCLARCPLRCSGGLPEWPGRAGTLAQSHDVTAGRQRGERQCAPARSQRIDISRHYLRPLTSKTASVAGAASGRLSPAGASNASPGPVHCDIRPSIVSASLAPIERHRCGCHS